MATNILNLLQEMSERHEIELVETNDLDDGTKELVYEAQDDLERISLIRIYQLPDA